MRSLQWPAAMWLLGEKKSNLGKDSQGMPRKHFLHISWKTSKHTGMSCSSCFVLSYLLCTYHIYCIHVIVVHIWSSRASNRVVWWYLNAKTKQKTINIWIDQLKQKGKSAPCGLQPDSYTPILWICGSILLKFIIKGSTLEVSHIGTDMSYFQSF